MAFGFFKKTQAADIIFHNGHIYTHDPDFPWAEAVACTDGKISAVGDFDAMDSFNGKHTELVDLGGPGGSGLQRRAFCTASGGHQHHQRAAGLGAHVGGGSDAGDRVFSSH